jgi:hypothetical protein
MVHSHIIGRIRPPGKARFHFGPGLRQKGNRQDAKIAKAETIKFMVFLLGVLGVLAVTFAFK